MHKIDKTEYGYHLVFADLFNATEVRVWLEESQIALSKAPERFGVFVDMRTCLPMSLPAKQILEEGQRLYKEKGMTRSVVIVNSPILKRQLEEIAKASTIYNWERYIDASSNSSWEKDALDWIIGAIDPDQELITTQVVQTTGKL